MTGSRALDDDAQRTILEEIGAGGFLAPACRAAGTSRQLVGYWRRLCEAGEERARGLAGFFAALDRATALSEAEAVASLTSGRGDWRATVWWLERRFPSRWGNRKPTGPRPADRRQVITEARRRAEERKQQRT